MQPLDQSVNQPVDQPVSEPPKHKMLVGNKILALSTPNQLWQVDSGSLGIFGIAWKDGEPVGARNYLFAITADEVAIGVNPKDYELIAIAFEPTKLHIADPPAESKSNNHREQVSQWCQHFEQIEGFPTSEPPLAFSAQYLQNVQQLIGKKHDADQQQFQQFQQLNQKDTKQTLQGLASLLKPKDDSFLSAETPLLVAAGTVGNVLGVKISPPSTCEDLDRLKEPLEAIARAS